MSETDQKELQEALENQIDIVLRLEQERLILLRENKIQKQKINELVNTLTQSSGRLKNNNEVHKNKEVDNKFIQTDEEEEILRSSVKNAEPPNVLDEAYSLLNKYKEKGSESTLNDSKKKNMKLSISISNKENLKDQTNISITQTQTSEKEILSKEIVNLTKDNNSFKCQLRTMIQTIKKLEKENFELKRTNEVKTENLEKLRKEIFEISKMFNSDKYKTVRNLECEMKRVMIENKTLKENVNSSHASKQELELEIENFKSILEKMTQEMERLRNKDFDCKEAIEREKNRYADQLDGLENINLVKTNKIEELTNYYCQLVKSLKDENDYCKGRLQSEMKHAEKTREDLLFYKTKFEETRNKL